MGPVGVAAHEEQGLRDAVPSVLRASGQPQPQPPQPNIEPPLEQHQVRSEQPQPQAQQSMMEPELEQREVRTA